MMRAVLDTNVVVSALIWGGIPFALLAAAAEGRIDLVTSPALLAEISEVLTRPHLIQRVQRVRGSVEDAVALYTSLAISVTPVTVPRAVPNDPDDDNVIAAAIAGQAEIIASGDRHLLSLGASHDILILRPAEVVASISAAPAE
jgi:putative PIN family toxin of toxin-antitoxin system